jgi:peroxiredoxin Q/BCP
MVKVGDKAPELTLPSSSGGTVSLAKLRGKKVVLYFYPRDDTPGCTREACDFRDNLGRVKSAGAEVFGVSKDSLASHERFRGKYELPFELLSDADNVAARAWGAYGTKVMYGKKVLGTIRSTFLIDEQGKVAAVWSPVKVDGHVDQVLAALAGEEGVAPSNSRKAAAKGGNAGAGAKKKVGKKSGKKKTARARKG